jgi:arylsulfatase A-like enzyme
MNVLVISVDTLRADRLGCYGCNRVTSPHIDAFAREGTVFLDMVAPHIPTHPAFTTMFTGHDVFSHQIVTHAGAVELDPGIPMLAETLRGLGYHTAAADNLGKWFSRGIDAYDSSTFESDFGMWGWNGENVNRVALARMNDAVAQDAPFFLWVHYWDPHTPYEPPPPFSRMFYEGDPYAASHTSMERIEAEEPFKSWVEQDAWQLRGIKGARDAEFVKAQYDAEVAYTDSCVAHLLTRLRELNLEEDTLVLFIGDHGEVMDEHAAYFDHHGLWDANVSVPIIWRLPGKIPTGQRLNGMVTTADVAPTILDAIGHRELIASLGMNGRSMLPLMEHGSNTGLRESVYLSECTWMRKRGLRTDRWKLIEALEPDFHGLAPVELYDLNERDERGSREQHNLADECPDVVANLRGEMMEHVRTRLRATGKPDPVETQEITLGKRVTEKKT